MSEIINLKLDDIVYNKSDERPDFYDESIERLASSIKNDGLLSPITVCKREDGKSINSKNLNDDVILIEEKPKRQMSEETKEKLRQARIQTKEAKAKKKKDLEDKLKLEEINNENSTENE